MKQYLREQVDWPQAFPPEEYATRRAKLRKALAADDLDAIYVTMPADITYLTGYDMVWYHSRSLTGLLLRADSDDPLFIDGWPHTTLVSTTPEITDVVFYERGPVADVIALIADRVKSQGLADGRLATQRWSYAPHGDVIDSLSDCLTEAGATVSDASFLIEEIRLIKSPLEIALMRKTANIADAAMAAARDAIRPGILETEIEGILIGAMMAAGGGYPALRSMIGSGPRSGTHHAPAQARAVKAGDLVFIDFCASLHRYHINLNRTFSLGEPDPPEQFLGAQPARREIGQQRVIRVYFAQLLEVRGIAAALIRVRQHDALVQSFHRPAVLGEGRRQPVQQLRMHRLLPHLAETVRRAHDAPPEMVLPYPVDHHPRGQRIPLVRNPLGQRQSPVLARLRNRGAFDIAHEGRDCAQYAGGHFLSGRLDRTPGKYEGDWGGIFPISRHTLDLCSGRLCPRWPVVHAEGQRLVAFQFPLQ